MPSNKFYVIAHRGWSGAYPENTEIAIRKAIELGVDLVEFDTMLTKDRKPILFHNSEIEKTTNGKGFLIDYNYEELKKFNAGSWMNSSFTDVFIPSLDDMLLLLQKNKEVEYNIEIKFDCWEEDKDQDSIEYIIAESIKKFQVINQVIISSFQWRSLERIKKYIPKARISLLYRERMEGFSTDFYYPELFADNISSLSFHRLKEKYNPFSFNAFCDELSQKIINLCHKNDMKVFTYTINETKKMQTYLNLNVDGIFTDHPDQLLSILKER